MTDQEHDVEDLIAALRDDLPSRDDERRVRTRLATAGVVVGVGSVATLAEVGSAAASAGAASSAATASSAAVGGGAALGTSGSLSMAAGSLAAQGSAVQGGGLAVVFAKVAGLGGGAKAALVTALAVGAGYPAVTTLLPASEPAALSGPVSLPAAPAHATKAAPITNAVPVTKAAPITSAAPVTEAAPIVNAAPVTKAAPASNAAPITQAAPRSREPAPVAARTSALEAETALIERALRAARAGDRNGALGWLSEHQRRYPNGALAPERLRALERLQH